VNNVSFSRPSLKLPFVEEAFNTRRQWTQTREGILLSRDALMRARSVVVNVRENVQREIMRGATEEQGGGGDPAARVGE
jgi:hypothetical protein